MRIERAIEMRRAAREESPASCEGEGGGRRGSASEYRVALSPASTEEQSTSLPRDSRTPTVPLSSQLAESRTHRCREEKGLGSEARRGGHPQQHIKGIPPLGYTLIDLNGVVKGEGSACERESARFERGVRGRFKTDSACEMSLNPA